MIIYISVMITVLVSASASEVAQLPFVISGYVFYENGSPAYNPDVTITNLNTSKTFSTKTCTSSNYYLAKPVLLSREINKNDVLQFKVAAGEKSAVLEYRITASDMVYHGLHLNITLGEGGGGEAEEETTSTGTGGGGKQTLTPSVTPTLTPSVPSQEASLSPVITPTPATATQAGKAISTPALTPNMALPHEKGKKKIPGFEAVFTIAGTGLLAIAYLIVKMRKGKRG